MSPDGILETCLYVSDLEAAERFYRDVLGLEFDSRQPGRHVFLRLGTQMLLLFLFNATTYALIRAVQAQYAGGRVGIWMGLAGVGLG